MKNDKRISQIMAVLNGHKSPAAVMKPKAVKPTKPKANPQPRFEPN